MTGKGNGRVRITVTLDAEVYDRIKKLGKKMGLMPASWVSMVATSKVNDIDVEVKQRSAFKEVPEKYVGLSGDVKDEG
jgi:hypothetical protein